MDPELAAHHLGGVNAAGDPAEAVVTLDQEVGLSSLGDLQEFIICGYREGRMGWSGEEVKDPKRQGRERSCLGDLNVGCVSVCGLTQGTRALVNIECTETLQNTQINLRACAGGNG